MNGTMENRNVGWKLKPFAALNWIRKLSLNNITMKVPRNIFFKLINFSKKILTEFEENFT